MLSCLYKPCCVNHFFINERTNKENYCSKTSLTWPCLLQSKPNHFKAVLNATLKLLYRSENQVQSAMHTLNTMQCSQLNSCQHSCQQWESKVAKPEEVAACFTSTLKWHSPNPIIKCEFYSLVRANDLVCVYLTLLFW